MGAVRQFRQETLANIKDAALDPKAIKKVKTPHVIVLKDAVGGEAIVSLCIDLKSAKYVRKNLRRFYKRTLNYSPSLKIYKLPR